MNHCSMNMSDKDHGSTGMPSMDHGSMVMPGMDHGAGKAPAQDHDDMKMPMKQADPLKNTSAMPGMSHGQSDSNATIPAHNKGAMDSSGGEMDHGDIQMQGGQGSVETRGGKE